MTRTKVEESVSETSQEPDLETLIEEIHVLKAQLANKDKELDSLKKKEEGWLVWTANPMYNGTTAGVLFTDGMAFIPEGKVFPRFIIDLPAPNQIEDMKSTPKGEKVLADIEKVAVIPTSKRMVDYLMNEFGYQSEYFTKDQLDQLQKRIKDRAKERAEAQEKLGNQSEMFEKLLQSHRL